MKITGLTIIRNAIINDYPIVEAISSILPVVDEMLVSVDPGEDNTLDLIRSINSPKIRIMLSSWDMSLRKDGRVLAAETNKALDEVSADTDWIFYIQADEVVPDSSHAEILKAANKYLPDKKVDGLLFKYLHFYGTYDYIGDSRKWYNCETRIIRNDKSIRSHLDAQGFRREGAKINVAAIDAFVYHYGWVKSPENMKAKQNNVCRYWSDDDAAVAQFQKASAIFDFNEFDSIKKFKGSHPMVMQKRIAEKNWNIELDTTKKKLSAKDKLMYYIEKITGKRLFAFRNHTVIR
ncbi:MAG: glycosyltransferase family 2 protein [Ferruginibacter sp.]|nr:glycosyltransferase family 2 protein [Ferruginibacter sp.]